MRRALSPNLAKTSTTDLDTINLTATHALADLPGGPLNLAIGGAWRYEATYDPDLNPNLAAQGLGIAHTIGNRTVASAFAELDAPIVKQFDVDVQGRFDHYSDVGNNFSPRVGVKWTPLRQIALRATYSLGFRAPSFSENGSSASEGFVTEFLPCSFVVQHGGKLQPDGSCPGGDAYTQQYNLATYSTANPHIKPEKSENFTVGAVIQPVSFLNFTVDYYHIKKTDVIAQPSAAIALADYFAGQPLPAGYSVTPDAPDPNPAYAGALPRPIVVEAPYINANSLITDGLDVDVQFKWTLPYDIKFTSDLNFTDIFSYKFSAPGQPTVDYVGTQSPYAISSGAGTPKWRGSWQNTFAYGPFSITGTAYYVSAMKMEALDYATGCFSTNPTTGGNVPANCTENAFIDFDLHMAYDVTPKVQVYTDIQNLFDAEPPLDPINYAAINYNPTYAQAGIVGRYFKVGVRAKF